MLLDIHFSNTFFNCNETPSQLRFCQMHGKLTYALRACGYTIIFININFD